MEIAQCIGCGCDDMHACVHTNGEACSWLAVDRHEGRGVCSACRGDLARWNAGDHSIAVTARELVSAAGHPSRPNQRACRYAKPVHAPMSEWVVADD